MRYGKRYSKPVPRDMVIKYAGACVCCGGNIPAGAWATYYPAGTIASRNIGAIGHVGGLEGTSQACYVELCKQMKARGEASTLYPDAGRDPGFVDLDRMVEDQNSDICGR
jgi:hypothetical protein